MPYLSIRPLYVNAERKSISTRSLLFIVSFYGEIAISIVVVLPLLFSYTNDFFLSFSTTMPLLSFLTRPPARPDLQKSSIRERLFALLFILFLGLLAVTTTGAWIFFELTSLLGIFIKNDLSTRIALFSLLGLVACACSLSYFTCIFIFRKTPRKRFLLNRSIVIAFGLMLFFSSLQALWFSNPSHQHKKTAQELDQTSILSSQLHAYLSSSEKNCSVTEVDLEKFVGSPVALVKNSLIKEYPACFFAVANQSSDEKDVYTKNIMVSNVEWGDGSVLAILDTASTPQTVHHFLKVKCNNQKKTCNISDTMIKR